MFDFILTNIYSGYIISNIEHLFREHLFESHYTCIQFHFSVLSGRSGWIFTKKGAYYYEQKIIQNNTA